MSPIFTTKSLMLFFSISKFCHSFLLLNLTLSSLPKLNSLTNVTTYMLQHLSSCVSQDLYPLDSYFYDIIFEQLHCLRFGWIGWYVDSLIGDRVYRSLYLPNYICYFWILDSKRLTVLRITIITSKCIAILLKLILLEYEYFIIYLFWHFQNNAFCVK